MNKYIASDIQDGITHLKAGIGNAIYDIINKERKEIELNIGSYYLIAVLKGFGYSLLYKDSCIILEQIPIQFDKVNNTYIVKGRADS